MCDLLIMSAPPHPTKMFFAWFAMPITSCGTTWPGDTIRSYFSSMRRRFTSTSTGSFHSPPEIFSISAAGTSPSFTTSVRQLCTIMLLYGMSPNIAFHCCSETGTCVPSAGRMSTLAPFAVSNRWKTCVMNPALEWKRVKSGGITRAFPTGPLSVSQSASDFSRTAAISSFERVFPSGAILNMSFMSFLPSAPLASSRFLGR